VDPGTDGPGGQPSRFRDWPALVAHFVANHRRSLASAAVLLALGCAALLVAQARFASDVLDLLPRHFDSVRVFKQFDREFSQARELTFAVVDEAGVVDLDAFVDHFAAMLRAEPWVERVMEKSPLESRDGVRDVQKLAAPLLLNLPEAEFSAATAALDPAALEARIARLRAALEAGSPKAEFDIEFDAIGIVGPALKPLAGSFSIEQTRPLASSDGTLRIVLALTRQNDLGARACQQTMQRVDALRERVLAKWDGPRPKILVTGRTAYVGELSLKMRNDVLSTLASSALLVALVFWIGFRRIRPLLAILHTLMLCCLVAVACGAFVFHELNMITIGLCAILVGLGVDFGMMLYGIYQAERDHGHGHEEAIAAALRHHGSGIIFGALTTAAAFSCLLWSECSGFIQLGVLIAIGIVTAGALMMTVFFVMLARDHRVRHSRLREAGARWVRLVWSNPKPILIAAVLFFAGLAGLGFGPFSELRFEANPKTLEPRSSQAGDALRTIQRKMPAAGEPVLAVIEAPDAETFHLRWSEARHRWSALVQSGVLKSVNSPAAFAISPRRVQQNAAALAKIDLDASRAALQRAAEREGLSAESIQPALGTLDTLAANARGEMKTSEWRSALPPTSAWWFVIDRFLARDAMTGVAYLTPAAPIESFAEKEALNRQLLGESTKAPEQPGEIHFSGWRYMLADLVPWAKGKLNGLTIGMLVMNFLLLIFLFRRVSSILIILTSLGLTIGALLFTLKATGIALNLFNILAFPLVLGVGVDYGIYVVIAMRAPDPLRELSTIFKPVLLSGLTTVAAFGSLASAQNPALSGLGIVCAAGVAWSLIATFFFILPVSVWRYRRRSPTHSATS
jgi:predicted RND superfamily exporter protein